MSAFRDAIGVTTDMSSLPLRIRSPCAARFTLAPQLDGFRAPTIARIGGAAALALVALFETLFLVGPKV